MPQNRNSLNSNYIFKFISSNILTGLAFWDGDVKIKYYKLKLNQNNLDFMEKEKEK